MARIIASSTSVGLSGMLPVANIPECRGVFGVHESSKRSDRMPQDDATESQIGGRHEQLDFQTGGVQVGRPLLQFSKERLVATCEAQIVPYVEDETNFDQTLTRRNAIRHVYYQNRLPEALSKPALLSFGARCAERNARHAAMAEEIFNSSTVHLETRSGSLTVELPDIEKLQSLRKPQPLDTNQDDLSLADAMFVRRLAAMITPRETIPLESLEKAVSAINPHGLGYPESDSEKALKTFNCAGLSFKCAGERFVNCRRSIRPSLSVI